MNLDKSLQQFGLSEKQAKVYLACLELGQDSVLSIARKAEIKRPTAYVTLDELIQKGLIRKVPKDKTTHYAAEDPNILSSVLEQKQSELTKAIPLLKALFNVRTGKPQIRYYEGKEGVRKIYSEWYKSKKYIYFYGSIRDIKKHFPECILDPSHIKKMNIPVLEIVTSHPVDLEYAQVAKKTNNPKHKFRALKKGVVFTLDSAIYDDKLAIVSLKDKFFGIIIESKAIAESYKILYELAWQSAEVV
ncbi:helix-turn-helix domain-containing protein [Patescibacteria group bacterium]|nr:helix-turn-helix domain-containing protein [Patescibacteria group bacterium]MBU0963833.1 helix-turn-helix domain-containing protein [Patescibacteria group bacterium]